MRIVALETSALSGSVAALQQDELLEELVLDSQVRTAKGLTPAIQRLLAEVGWKPNHIQLIAVTQGPGSFTGLRVGITTAKLLAYAAGAQVIGVDTLETIASRAPAEGGPVCTVIDAQRRQLLAALWSSSGGTLPRPIQPPTIVSPAELVASLPEGTRLTGPGLRGLSLELPNHLHVLDPQYWLPLAGSVGRIGWHHYQQGKRDDLWSLSPRYHRASAAEEKWAERRGEGGTPS